MPKFAKIELEGELIRKDNSLRQEEQLGATERSTELEYKKRSGTDGHPSVGGVGLKLIILVINVWGSSLAIESNPNVIRSSNVN